MQRRLRSYHHPGLRRTARPEPEQVVAIMGAAAEAIHAWHRQADEIAGAPTEWMLSEPGDSIPPSPRWLYSVFVRAARSAGIETGRSGPVWFCTTCATGPPALRRARATTR